jgi:hypothetical protein
MVSASVVRLASPLISGRRREVLQDHARRRSVLPVYGKGFKKPFKLETLSRGFLTAYKVARYYV